MYRVESGRSSKKEMKQLFDPESDSKKVCTIFSMGGHYGIFLVDLNDSQGVEDGEFVKTRPNILLRDFDSLAFSVVGLALYIFDSDLLYDDSVPTLYRLILSSTFAEASDIILDRSKLEIVSHMLSPKVNPSTLRYGSSILLFSTQINYSDSSSIDFELYESISNTFTKLPQLLVRRKSGSTLELVHDDDSCEELTDRSVSVDPLRSFFYINAYSLMENSSVLIIQADIGYSFSLNLDEEAPHRGWRLFGDPLFQYHNQNYMITPRLVLNSAGVCIFGKDPGLNSKFGVVSAVASGVSGVGAVTAGRGVAFGVSGVGAVTARRCVAVGLGSLFRYPDGDFAQDPECIWSYVVQFPFSSSLKGYISGGLNSSSIAFLGPTTNVPCIVEVGVDYIERPYWIIEVLNLDFSKLKFGMDKKEVEQFAKLIKTFKFRLINCYPMFCVEGLFPF